MNKRLERFLAAENISQAKFADTINVARASVSHILSGRNKPGFDFIESMAAEYPNLDVEWLITGRGKMYKNTTVDAPKQETPASSTPLYSSNSAESVQKINANSNIANTESLETPSLFTPPFSSDFSNSRNANESNSPDRTYDNSFERSADKSTQNTLERPTEKVAGSNREEIPSLNKHIVKIIAFYSDGSFKELK